MFRHLKYLLIVMLLFCSMLALHAHVVVNGAKLVIKEGTVKIAGGLANKTSGGSDGEINLSGNLEIPGNISNSAGNGVFKTGSTGTVTLTGGNQSVSGPVAFPNLTKTVTTSATLTFQDGSGNRVTVTGTLTLQGVAGELLLLRSASSGTQWEIDPQGTRTLDYLDVQDSVNANNTPIISLGHNITDSGNNVNWGFLETFRVDFLTDGNGTLTGNTEQYVLEGYDCSPVTANGNLGYSFDRWTGDKTGTSNPLTVTNVRKNMTITATFQLNSYTARFEVVGKGIIQGDAVQEIPHGGNCTMVTAEARENHEFVSWSGDYVGTANPLTLTNVTSDMLINANFQPEHYVVTFTAGADGSITGTLVQTVIYGGDCTQVIAVADASNSFIGWSGDYVGINNPLTVTHVMSDLNIDSNYRATTAIERITVASKLTVNQSEISGITQFSKRPQVYGFHYDPIKDPEQVREKKGMIKVLTKVNKNNPVPTVACEWRRRVGLYDKSSFKKAYKAGTTCETYLVANPIDRILCGLRIRTRENGTRIVSHLRSLFLVPPDITAVRNQGDTADIASATLNDIFLIKGDFFPKAVQDGRVNPPRAWLEYADKNGKIKILRLKVLRPFKYADARGIPGLSCMNVDTGASEIMVQMPARWPKGWDHGVDHNIVIQNGMGVATVDFGTMP